MLASSAGTGAASAQAGASCRPCSALPPTTPAPPLPPCPPLVAATSGPPLTVAYFQQYKAAGVQTIMAAETGQPREWVETTGTAPPSAAPVPPARRLLQAGSGRVLVLNKVRPAAGSCAGASKQRAGRGRRQQM